MNKIELAELLRDMADKLIEMENKDNKQTQQFMKAVAESFSSINKDKKADKIIEMDNKKSSDIVESESESESLYSSKKGLYDFLQDNIANKNNLYIKIIKNHTYIKYYTQLRKASFDLSYIDGPLIFSISFNIKAKEIRNILGDDYDPENNTDITNDTHDGPFGEHYKRFRFEYHGYIDKYNIFTQYLDYDYYHEVAILSFLEHKG